jgi:hypothetical protein
MRSENRRERVFSIFHAAMHAAMHLLHEQEGCVPDRAAELKRSICKFFSLAKRFITAAYLLQCFWDNIRNDQTDCCSAALHK